jgi:hypothetical protein
MQFTTHPLLYQSCFSKIILVNLRVAAFCICRLGEGFTLGEGFKLTTSVWDIKSIVDTFVSGIVALLSLNKRRRLVFRLVERIV